VSVGSVGANTGSEDRPIDVDNRAIPAIDLDRPIPAIPVSQSSRTLLTERPRKVRKDSRGQDTHEWRYENWIRWYEKNGNKAKHNTRASKRSTTILAYAQRYGRELNTGMMDIANVKDGTVIKYGLEYDGNRWITTLTTDEMKCIDECKNGTDKEDTCVCDMSDTESVTSLTEAEVDKLIRDVSSKVLKATDKPTTDKPTNTRKKKAVAKVIENVVDTATSKLVRKPPQRYMAK
jgi:hypothetical protein